MMIMKEIENDILLFCYNIAIAIYLYILIKYILILIIL